MMYSEAKKGKRATRASDSFRALRVEENRGPRKIEDFMGYRYRRLSSKVEGGIS